MDIVEQIVPFTEHSSNDSNIEFPAKGTCKYYSVKEYQLLNKTSNFNIFHSNINGLESKLDNLHEFLTASSTKLDLLAITETSEKEDTGFLNNVEIEGYEKYHTPSKTSKGGTAIYVNKDFDTISRTELNINNVEFESTWIEIKNKTSKNIVCGTLYRHPHYNFDVFFKYLESCLSTLAKENKEIYISGDFNFNLLQIDSDHFTQYFLICSVVMVCYHIFYNQLE